MKYLPIDKFLIFFAALFIFSSCQKDVDIPIDVVSQTYPSNIVGYVIDNNGETVANVNVTFNGLSVLTDEDGTFKFEDILVDSRHNHINFTKDGYYENTETFVGTDRGKVAIQVELVPLDFKHSFNASNSAKIVHENITINFPENAIVDINGNNYSGEVKVSILNLDPSEDNTYAIMPGNLTAIDDNNNLGLLRSFGMLGVELRGENNETLQLNGTSKATIEYKVDEDLLADAPEELPLWHFDHSKGLWVEEGKASLSNGIYSGEVSHFSYWNFDYSVPYVIISGTITNEDGITLLAGLSFEGSQSKVHGYTDLDGFFTGPVEANSELVMEVYQSCGEFAQPIYSVNIGPFSEDTNIGNTEVGESGIHYVTITAEFLDCNGNAITDGHFKLSNTHKHAIYFFTDAMVNETFAICDIYDNISVKVVDRKSAMSKELGDLSVPGTHEFGQVTVCDNIEDHLRVKSTTYGIDETLLDSLVIFSNQNNQYLTGLNVTTFTSLSILYEDENSNEINTGTFPISSINFYINDGGSGNWISFEFQEGTVTITESNEDPDLVIGTFEFNAKIEGTEEEHSFDGSFKYSTIF